MPRDSITHRTPLTRALVVAVITGGYLAAMGVDPPVHRDTARDMLLARDGLAFGTFEGAEAAFGHFRQGALWVRFLAMTFAAGLGPAGQHLILASLIVLSVCLFDHGARNHFGDDVGSPSTAIFLVLLIVAIGYPIMSNPIFAPLGVVCSMLALLRVITSGTSGAAFASGASLALAAEGHPAALLMAPVVVAIVCLSCRQPVRAVLFSIVGGVVPSFAVSSTTWLNNGEAMLRETWYLALIVVGFAAAVFIATVLRGRWLALDVDRRCRWFLVMTVGAVGGQTVAASILSHAFLLFPHYHLAALPALAILTGLGLRRIGASSRFPRSGRVVSIVVPAFFLLVPLSAAGTWRLGLATGVPSLPYYSMREAEILAAHFWKAGYSFPDVQRHLRGPESLVLLAAIAPFAPAPDSSFERPMPDLRILAFSDRHAPNGGVPSDARRVDLGRGRKAWILPLDGWIELAPARICFASPDGAREPVCRDVATSSIRYAGRYRDLALPSLDGVHDAQMQFREASRSSVMQATWELRVVVRGDDRERHVQLVGLLDAPWVIERVDGMGHRGELPSRHVILDRSEGSSGRIVLKSLVTQWTQWRDYPPDFVETRSNEAILRQSIEQLPPLGRRICEMGGTCP